MGRELVDLLITVVKFCWPFQVVREYERCVYYACGHLVRPRWYFLNEHPGLKVRIPFFCEIAVHPCQPTPLTLPRQSITLRDGTALVFQVKMTLQVVDVAAAETEVNDYVESAQENAAGIIATRLMELEMEQFTPDRRGKLLGGLKQSITADLKRYGCILLDLEFTQFALGARTYRVFNDVITGSGYDV